MQKSTMALGAVLLTLALFTALFLILGTLGAEMTVTTASAADHVQAFSEVLRVLDSGAAPRRFSDSIPRSADECRLEDVRIALHNPGLIPAEWISAAVEPAPEDLAVYSVTGEGETIEGLGRGEINLKLITRANFPGPRVCRVTYYIFGMKREIRVQEKG